ncbi:unnamed protein product, partial [marine sediment metagenome]
FQSSAYYDPWMEKIILKTVGTAKLEFFATPHWERSFSGVSEGAAEALRCPTRAGANYAVYTSTGGRIVEGWAQGHNPFGQTFIKTFGGDDIEDCWQISYTGSGRLELKAGATPDDEEYVRVYTQQIRKY